MADFNGIVYLTEDQYIQLKNDGSLTVEDITVNFDESTLYVTPQEDASGGGTIINVGGVPQSVIDFDSDPQEQLNDHENRLSSVETTLTEITPDVSRALKVPMSAPVTTKLVAVDTNNGQTMITIGEGLTLEDDVLTASVDSSDFATTEFVRNVLMRETEKLNGGVAIPANSDLNSENYVKVGNYFCELNTTVKTLKNCPAVNAFKLTVYSPIDTEYDDESTKAYLYRVRKLETYTGLTFIQTVETAGSIGEYVFGEWKKIITTDEYYDIVITTQAEFEQFYKSLDAGTCKASSVLFVGNGETLVYKRTDGKGLVLPDSLHILAGHKNAKIRIDNYNASVAGTGAVRYESAKNDRSYIMKDLQINVVTSYSGSSYSSSYNFVAVLNAGILDGCKIMCTYKNHDGCCVKNVYGMNNCICEQTVTNSSTITMNGPYVVHTVNQFMSNCIVRAYGTNQASDRSIVYMGCVYGANNVSNTFVVVNMTNSGGSTAARAFRNCSRMVNCYVSMTGTTGSATYAYQDCSYCSNCQSASLPSGSYWSGTNTKRDDNSCTT